MGLLSNLLRRASRATTAPQTTPASPSAGGTAPPPHLARASGAPPALPVVLYEGDETLEVVGESFYQENLWHLAGGYNPYGVRADVFAVLVPEPDNQYDRNAIRVQVDGLPVGHLSREDAIRYGPGLHKLMEVNHGSYIALRAMIAGGGEALGTPMLGIFLDHNPADFGVASGFRTGFTLAWASDERDDSYDLSWFSSLSANDGKAITQLRKLLAEDPDPIDRHYMFSELERRLYKCRDAFASALDDYDEVCRQHDSEIDVIRKALVAKFGSLPLLETYKQATIRHHKAKNWPAAVWWAERGIAVYGNDAGVEGVVEDLMKRRQNALGRMQTATAPKPPRQPKAVPAPVNPVGEVEHLVCAKCGVTFERVRTRGRKPTLCPGCRAA